MLRTISSHLRQGAAPLRSLTQILTYLPQPSLSFTPISGQIPSQLKVPVDPSARSILATHSFGSISILSSPFSQSPARLRHEGVQSDEINRGPTAPPRLLVVQPRLRPESLLQAKLDEALNLANSLEEQRGGTFDTELWEKESPPHVVVQNPAARSTHADTYFGKGTVDTVKCHLNAIESEDGVDAVFVNATLTGIQQRNLERVWGKPVLDRVGLIIEIFHAHAFTKEAKLQAELAALMYKRSRLVRVRGADGRHTFGAIGEAEVVSARGRGSGGRGFISGAGETELQLQRRRILERRRQLLSEIKEVRRTRALQRAARKRHGGEYGGGMATVAVVGYTNAGKSTLVSALSNCDLYGDDRLFATVDPKVRSVNLPSGRTVLLSDTVGFISDLPVQLVEAFHATMEEVVEADLLVHVLDSSAPDLEEQRKAVLHVLEQIGVPEDKLQNMIEVWNKIDLQDEGMAADGCLENSEEDEVGGLSGPEDNVSEHSARECDNEYEDNNNTVAPELLSDVIEDNNMDDEQDDYSDSWLSSHDGAESWVDEDGSSIGLGNTEDQQSWTSKTWTKMNRDSNYQSQYVPHVKTSAITGVGLQELLELVDSKLKTENIAEKNILKTDMVFHRKWRPSRTEDAGMAVEH